MQPADLPASARRRAWSGIALALALALLLHAGVLQWVQPQPGARPTGPAVPAVLPWREVLAPPAPAALAQSSATTAGPQPAASPAPAAGPVSRVTVGHAQASASAAQGEPQEASAVRELAQGGVLPPGPAQVVPAWPARPAEPGLPDAGLPRPTFSTRPPPAFQWTFAVQRGAQQGQAEMRWQPDGDRYELSLEMQGTGPQRFGQVSRGGFDAAGLAPERFVDRRRGRDRLAVNFDRSAGQVTFSGPQVRHPLVSGSQDRLSWMIQLAAILDADPARFGVGAQVPLFVAGPRGDADTWLFQVRAREAVELADGTVREALRVLREPSRPYDTRVQVWLDPQRHHLPVRLRIEPVPAGETLDYGLLREMGTVAVP